jgi:hypothetical protein
MKTTVFVYQPHEHRNDMSYIAVYSSIDQLQAAIVGGYAQSGVTVEMRTTYLHGGHYRFVTFKRGKEWIGRAIERELV